MVCRRSARSSRQQSGQGPAYRQRNGVADSSRQSKTTKKTCKERRDPQDPRCTRKIPVKSQQSVNQFILLSVKLCPRPWPPSRSPIQLSIVLILMMMLVMPPNCPNGQPTYIHETFGTGKTIIQALQATNQVILRERPTSPHYIIKM